MNIRSLFFRVTMLAVIFYCSSCQQSTGQASAIDTPSVDDTAAVSDTTASAVTENFEQARTGKPSYAASVIAFKTGRWLLYDALLAGSGADAKQNDHSIRLRNTGKISMQFDVNCAKEVHISYATYANDGPSTWQLWASADEGKTYSQVGATVTAVSHTLTDATFTANFNHAVRLEIRKVSGGKNRINIDDFIIYDSGSAAVDHDRAAIDTGRDIAGDDNKKAAEMNEPGYAGSNLLLGNPSGATSSTVNADNYLINQQYYAESYSRTRAEPNWVSWHIGLNDLGSTDRLNNFRPDITLPEGWYEADQTGYKGSGFDKGHNCPSGDRTSSTAANSSTFLMDNIIPQAPNNNQHTWEHLESYCRDQVRKGNEVYVIMGSYGSGGTGRNGYATTIDEGKINVPAHIWKVVMIIPEGDNDLQRINTNTIVIAINTPNDDTISSNWMNYLCTVWDIEKETGYNLLSALPRSVQEAIENRKFAGGN